MSTIQIDISFQAQFQFCMIILSIIVLQIGAMLKYLENKYGDRATKGDKNHLQIMRNEANRLEQLVNEMKEKQKAEASDEKSEKGSEMESEEDVSQIIQINLTFF